MESDLKSIHYRRRWFYALWSSLLVASFVALVLWEIPGRTGKAKVQIQVTVAHAPQGCRAQVWAGPRKSWRRQLSSGDGLLQGQTIPENGTITAPLELPVAYRRWTGTYIQGNTADLIVLVFLPQKGTPRYASFPLNADWNTGLLRPDSRMKISMECDWETLWRDPRHLSVSQ